MSPKQSSLALAELAVILALVASAWAASRETVLYDFNGKNGWGVGGLIMDSAGDLYGTTTGGGNPSCTAGFPRGCGVAFRLARDTDGKWHETILHVFGKAGGYSPFSNLVFDKAGNLYGTAAFGGNFAGQCRASGCGVVFRLTHGAGGKWTEKVLHAFDTTDGLEPLGGLVFDSAGSLYGTTSAGGGYTCLGSGCGVVFKLTPGARDQWSETVLFSFDGRDGYYPRGSLIFDAAGNLYGTTVNGGDHGWGAVFKLTLDRGQWTESVLHSFDYNTDGSAPSHGLMLDSSGNLYGTASLGGTHIWGAAFKLTRDADGKWKETVLHSFDRNDLGGGFVSSGLVADKEGNLYGTAYEGGKYKCPAERGVGCGVVFRLTSDANGKWTETVLHSFGKGKDGAEPGGGLAIDSAGHLFGLTREGGYLGGQCGKDEEAGCGVVFDVTP